MHSAGIMHRDLKSENILIDEECRIKICDFGMARTISPNPFNDYDENSKFSEKPEFSKSTTIATCLTRNLCTRWYRAPELYLLEDHYDSKLDMWGLGCIISEMTYLNHKKDVQNTDKILFISEEEQQNIISDNDGSTASTDHELFKNIVDSSAVKNILNIIGP